MIEIINVVFNKNPVNINEPFIISVEAIEDFNTHSELTGYSHAQLSKYTHDEVRRNIDTFNTYTKLSSYKHIELEQYTHDELRRANL